ncbi:MAG TPA: thioredoxin family protein [Bacilli bacterium]|nr:thioredoxin family protein [Bacilli bacterium]
MKIIKFGAIWCPGCLVMRNTWLNIRGKYKDIEIVDYDYDNDKDRLIEYSIEKKLPVIIFIDKDNNEVKRLVGEQSEKDLEKEILEVIDL